MKCGARVAGAMATGYMLGRTKKMKLALMMGSWAAGQKFGSPAELLSKGTELLRKSPEFAQLNDEVRVKLIDAGKAAVAAAAAQRLTKLTDSVGSSAERVAAGGPLRVARSDEDDGGKPGRRSLLRFRRRGDAESAEVEDEAAGVEPEDETEEDATPSDAAEEDTDTEAPSDTADDEDETDEDETGEVVDEEPAPKRRRAPAKAASGGQKAPVKRASAGASAARSRAPRASTAGKTAAAAKSTARSAAKPAARGGKSAAARSGAK